ncbi:AAA family ATPase, partial [Paraburkholderia sediminicola]|uniref:AAA family ATPase n=1 Tax=Paraburkholderia sediminicola TaxID=458836 RepID=UPI0038BC6E9C
MIKAIAKIKGLGVYENYVKPLGTQEFGVKNLIYGWNYSGKTTLSRLFAQLENKTPNPDLGGCSFALEIDNGSITEANYTQSGLTVRVFNSDFIRDNLHFGGEHFKPILLLGQESDQAQKKLDNYNERIKKTLARIREIKGRIGDIEGAVSQAKTEAAKNIRQTLKLDPYTATHLNSDITTVTIIDSQPLSEKDLQDELELSLTPDSKKPGTVDRLSASPSIEPLHKEAISILATTPSLAHTIKHLEKHSSIERWVEAGLSLHADKETCEFCGGDVTKHRLAELQAHFSKDLGEQKQKVVALLTRVHAAKIELTLPREAEFNPQFRGKFNQTAAILPEALAAFNQAVATLAADVQLKVDAPFKPVEPTPIAEHLAQPIIDSIKAINAVIDENNELAVNFSNAKATAIKRVRYHYVRQFVDTQSKSELTSKITHLQARQDRLQIFVKTMQRELETLHALISQAQRGREEINERLASMLGSEAVQIKVVKDATAQERFQLVRKTGKPAKNLSDGERTAVAFSYFLAKLKELKPGEFKETVVYVDDPISSLDANHLFQVAAAIKEAFFWKNEANTWTTRCKQFFLSTHNFQFFDLVREIDPKKQPRAALFFLRKVSPTQSILGNMPKSLCKYASEYHFLFETILNFRAIPDKSAYDNLMLLPNAVRRFTELYTYSRIPTDTDGTVDRRAEALFGPET